MKHKEAEMSKKQVLKHIHDNLENLNIEDLQQVQHAIHSLQSAKEGGLHYVGRFLGIELLSAHESVMKLGKQNTGAYGQAQGGVLYTLADVTIGFHILNQLEKDELVYTLELKMNYIKPGKGTLLKAKPQILHRGRTTVAAQCAIEDDEGDLVAIALGTFYITKRKS